VTRIARAQEASAAKYLSQHAKSSQKRRDGWFIDFPSNMARANRAGEKALKVGRLLFG
jgi:hypothetical protein